MTLERHHHGVRSCPWGVRSRQCTQKRPTFFTPSRWLRIDACAQYAMYVLLGTTIIIPSFSIPTKEAKILSVNLCSIAERLLLLLSTTLPRYKIHGIDYFEVHILEVLEVYRYNGEPQRTFSRTRRAVHLFANLERGFETLDYRLPVGA